MSKGAGSQSLSVGINTTMLTGRLAYYVFGLIAQFERECNSARTGECLMALQKLGTEGILRAFASKISQGLAVNPPIGGKLGK